MLPPDERLDARELAARQVVDRLVIEDELLVLRRPQQVRPQLEALQHRVVHGRLEDLVPALPFGLGHVHGDVGVAHHFLCSLGPA